MSKVLDWLLIPLWPLCWVLCRLAAKKCPYCHEKWHTTLVGEWFCEDWHCLRCGNYWEERP